MDFKLTYIILSLLNVVIFYRVWNIYNLLNPYISLYIGIFLFVVMGGFYDGYGLLHVIDDKVKIYVLISFYLYLAGGLISNFLATNRDAVDRNFSLIKKNFSNTLNFTNINKIYNQAAWILYIGGILLTLYIYSQMSVIPLFSSNVHYFRVEELKGHGILHKISLSSMYISVIFFTIRYAYTKNISPFKLAAIIFIPFVILQGYAIRADTLKVIAFPLTFLMALKLKPNLSHIGIALVLAVTFFSVNACLQFIRHYPIEEIISGKIIVTGQSLFTFTTSNFLHRFWVQLENLEYLIKGIGYGTLNGRTYLIDLLMLLPGEEYSQTAGQFLKDYVGLKFSGGGITPTLFGESYANWGMGFAYLITFFIGFFLNYSYLFIIRYFQTIENEKLIARLILFYIVSVNIYGIATSTFMGLVVQVFLPALASMIAFIFIAEFLKMAAGYER